MLRKTTESRNGFTRASGRRKSSAFTLVELLVVIAIIGVLIGLLLPAIQAARESARKSQCSNNMKQLALGLHNFHDAHGHLPSSIRPASGIRTGWMTLILPYVEKQQIYDRYDQNASWDAPIANAPYTIPNVIVVATRIPTFECPSTPNPERLDGDTQPPAGAAKSSWDPSVAAPTDYSTITHVESRIGPNGTVTPPLVDPTKNPYGAGTPPKSYITANTAGGTASAPMGNGVMPKNAKPKFSDVKDGLSNTILIAESAGRPQVYRRHLAYNVPPTSYTNGGGWCRPASDFGFDSSTADGATLPGNSTSSCAINCTNGEDIAGQAFPLTIGPPYGTNGTGEPYSFHAEGINVAFGDGSVRFLNERILVPIFAGLVTRDASESLDPGDVGF